jgi:hypothetical protein
MLKGIPKPKIFKPKNPQKYKGDSTNIWTRSSWETRVMKYLDTHPQVIWWSSEELFIPYKSPVDNKVHRYFPDFIFEIVDKQGKKTVHMWEIKPHKQTQKPVIKRKTKQALLEMKTYVVNQEKWKAAELFCLEHGWKFSIITEKELGI